MSLRRSSTVAALVALLSGCYAYQPVGVEQVRPQQKVRVRLTASEANRLEQYVGTEDRDVDGQVVESSADSLMILVPGLSELRGARVETLHQRVNVARSGIADLELRQLDRPRTYLVTGVIGAIVLGIAIDQVFGHGGSDVVDTTPTPNENRIPAGLRIPLRLWGR